LDTCEHFDEIGDQVVIVGIKHVSGLEGMGDDFLTELGAIVNIGNRFENPPGRDLTLTLDRT